MKTPCKVCAVEPKYTYTMIGKRLVYMRCPSCGRMGPMCASDPTAVKYWNRQQA